MVNKPVSAGLLMYRRKESEVFLAHPGGPYFVNKDKGYWGIPKGLIDEGEDHLAAAVREFEEEVGVLPGSDDFIELGTASQKSGKIVYAWAFEGDWPDGKNPDCNLFSLEWPPKSGKTQEFPEVDKVRFFSLREARNMMTESQQPFLNRLLEKLERDL